jgi:hypothetical protein
LVNIHCYGAFLMSQPLAMVFVIDRAMLIRISTSGLILIKTRLADTRVQVAFCQGCFLTSVHDSVAVHNRSTELMELRLTNAQRR